MSEHKRNLPQEWPEHLASDAVVSPVKTIPPISESVLDFAGMHPETFEQFCWWLLKKDWALAGCKRLGDNGKMQDGIDLLAFDEHHSDKLLVFECKAWKAFDATKLTLAIDAFMKGGWANLTSKFTIVLAQRDVGLALEKRWHSERRRLRQAGIDGELWTAHDLTLKVQAYPDILSKFFPWHSVEHYANQWMQRVAFYELVTKSFFDPRERVAHWARELIAQPNHNAHCGLSTSDAETYRKVSQHGNSWHFKGPWFSLSAVLPDERFTHASAAITFNRPDMQGMTITIDHKWLLKRFLFRERAPLTGQHRSFITGSIAPNDNQYLIDLPHSRFLLQEEGVQEIADAADLLTEAMRKSLRELEVAWSALDFPFVMWAGKKVALTAIDTKVWHEIGRFAEDYYVSNGSTQWHMFDGNSRVLKPYHETGNEHFDAGYHGVFYATEIEGISFKREVVLLWQPNELRPNQAFSPRGWWSCEFAFKWLKETLLPEVKRRVYERNFGKMRKRIFRSRRASEFSAYLDELFVARDLRRPPLFRNGSWSTGIVESVQALQRFFYAAGTPEPNVHKNDIEDLYRTIATLAKSKRGYVGYAGSTLGLHRSPVDHSDLIDLIHEHIREGRVVAGTGAVDCALRVILEVLDGSDTWLSDSDRLMIRKSTAPFARLRDDAILVERHTHGPEFAA